MSIRLVSVNLLSDLSLWEKRSSLLVDELSRIRPDLIALQEVSIPAENAQWLAAKLDMPHLYLCPKGGDDRSLEGIAILSQLPFERRDALDLGTQNRVAQRVQVRIGDRSLVLANTHLFWQPGESAGRVGQVERLLEWLKPDLEDQAVVLCGDLNASPDTTSVQILRRDFRSAYAAVHGREPEYTWPTPLPRSRLALLRTLIRFFRYIRWTEIRPGMRNTLDYIFVNDRIQVQDCQLLFDQPKPDQPNLYASDHFGLAATLSTR